MTTPILNFQPVRDSYTMVPAYNVTEIALDGGKSRRRVDILGGVHVVTPTWILDKTEYTVFMGFFREHIVQGSLQFRVSLLTEQAFVIVHLATLIGGMPKLVQQAGDAYYVTATLEVTPNPCKAFAVQFKVAAGPLYQVVDTGTFSGPGDISEFPVGRTVRITGTRQTQGTWGGVFVDLEGVYTIDSIASATTFNLLNAPVVNTAWTVLAGLSPASTTIGIGACILIPQ